MWAARGSWGRLLNEGGREREAHGGSGAQGPEALRSRGVADESEGLQAAARGSKKVQGRPEFGAARQGEALGAEGRDLRG